MKIIVTGGAGFIGSHVVDAYVKAGHRVSIIDNLSTGFKNYINPKARFYKADIRELKTVEKIFKLERPAIVNHHAALVSVAESVRDPVSTIAINVLGTLSVLLALGKYGAPAKRLIFPSTGGTIYGDPKKLPVDEKTPLNPLAPYPLSKLMDEELVKFYAHHYGFNYLIFRYSNVYGPRQNPKGEAGVVAIFGDLMKNGRRPTIFGDGTKARDYVHVEDIVRANLAALSKGKNEIINLGCGKKITDQNIFDEVAVASGFHGKPIYAPYRRGEVYQIALDVKKAFRKIGWRPKIKLSDGIRETVKSL